MDIVTRLLSFISPAAAIKRFYAFETLKSIQESARTYDGAKPNRFTKNKKISDGNAAQELISSGDIAKLRKTSRYLYMNSPIARAAIKAFVAATVGKFVTVQFRATDKEGNPLTDVNKVLNRLFKIWSNRCDLRGKKTLNQFIRQACEQYMITGEYFIQKLYRDDPICQLRLSSVDSDLIDHTKNTDTIIGGIEFDKDWKPKSYYLVTDDISSKKKKNEKKINAEDMIHSYLEDRPGQVRGEPWLAPVMDMLWSANRAFASELMSLEVQSCLSVVYKSGTGQVGGRSAIFGAGGSNIQDATAGVTQKLAPATIIGIPAADDIKIIDPSKPSGAFTAFIDKVIEITTSAINISYAKTTKDYSKGNFASQRMGELDVRRQCAIIQDSLLVSDIIKPIVEIFVKDCILKGHIKASDFAVNPDLYTQFDASFQPYEYMQPLQDAQADMIKFNSKLYSMDELLDGADPEEHIKKLGEHRKIANEQGIELYPKDTKVMYVGGTIGSVSGDEAQQLE